MSPNLLPHLCFIGKKEYAHSFTTNQKRRLNLIGESSLGDFNKIFLAEPKGFIEQTKLFGCMISSIDYK